MRVSELLDKLSDCEPGAEVVIVTSLNTVVELLGVIDEGDAVLLDPATDERSIESSGVVR